MWKIDFSHLSLWITFSVKVTMNYIYWKIEDICSYLHMTFLRNMFLHNIVFSKKEDQIVYRLFLVNCYLLHVPRLPFQLASSSRGWVIDFIWLELPWQYIAMTRNNLSIILISLVFSITDCCYVLENQDMLTN